MASFISNQIQMNKTLRLSPYKQNGVTWLQFYQSAKCDKFISGENSHMKYYKQAPHASGALHHTNDFTIFINSD